MGLFSACGNNATKTTSDNLSQEKLEEVILFDRLIGLWKTKTKKLWALDKNADGSYLSVGFQVKNADTVFTEHVYVHRENGQWISENTVSGQNEGKAIKFTVVKLNQDIAHFSNPTHDFPTDIYYHLADDNILRAFIAGPNPSGNRDTIPFNFMRVVN